MTAIALGRPIRFVAVQWVEDQWDHDHPTLLLEPMIRYSPNGQSVERMIEDAVEEIGEAFRQGIKLEDEDVTKEFDWRKWSIDKITRLAFKILSGRSIPGYRAISRWHHFAREDGDIVWWEVSPPGT